MKRQISAFLTSLLLITASFVFLLAPARADNLVQSDTKPTITITRQGCCSHHNGVCGCGRNGHTGCCDGTTSPSCSCFAPSSINTQKATNCLTSKQKPAFSINDDEFKIREMGFQQLGKLS